MKRSITISSAIVLTALAVITAARNPILLKIPIGKARVISNKVNAAIYLDGQKSNDSYLFKEGSHFDKTSSDRLILWVEDGDLRRKILIVHTEGKSVGQPNSGKNCYALLFGNLIQAESACISIPIGSEKSWRGHDLKFKSEQGIIEFELPTSDSMPAKNLKIIIKQQ